MRPTTSYRLEQSVICSKSLLWAYWTELFLNLPLPAKCFDHRDLVPHLYIIYCTVRLTVLGNAPPLPSALNKTLKTEIKFKENVCSKSELNVMNECSTLSKVSDWSRVSAEKCRNLCPWTLDIIVHVQKVLLSRYTELNASQWQCLQGEFESQNS